jgi:hypothetical protein
MTVRYIEERSESCFVVNSIEKEPKVYFSSVNTHLSPLIVIYG